MILTKNKGVIAVQDIAASTTTNRAKGIGASELEVSQVRGVQHSDTSEYGEPVVDHEKVQGEGWHDKEAPVAAQGYHRTCWTKASSGNISDARFHRGIDETRTRYSSTFLLDVVDHSKARMRLSTSFGEHSCYGYSTDYVGRRPSEVNRVHVLNDVRCFKDVNRVLHYLKGQPIIGTIAVFLPEFADIRDTSPQVPPPTGQKASEPVRTFEEFSVDHEKVQGEGWHDKEAPVAAQGYHRTCWTKASSGNISDARFHRGIDETRTRHSSTFLLDVVDHSKARMRLSTSFGEHSCYGYSTFRAMEYIMNNGIPKSSDWRFSRKCSDYVGRRPSEANRVHVLNDVRCFKDVNRVLHYLKAWPFTILKVSQS
uniref:Uncharacterized protein n=1 Tax=Brassica campestris TaxID=3711 RepID=M4D218_BRACM